MRMLGNRIRYRMPSHLDRITSDDEQVCVPFRTVPYNRPHSQLYPWVVAAFSWVDVVVREWCSGRAPDGPAVAHNDVIANYLRKLRNIRVTCKNMKQMAGFSSLSVTDYLEDFSTSAVDADDRFFGSMSNNVELLRTKSPE